MPRKYGTRRSGRSTSASRPCSGTVPEAYGPRHGRAFRHRDPGGTRTLDLQIRSLSLYPLSYGV